MSPGAEQPWGLFGTAVPAESQPPTHPQPTRCSGSVRNGEGLDAVQALFSNSQNISMLSTLFWSQIHKTAPYGL